MLLKKNKIKITIYVRSKYNRFKLNGVSKTPTNSLNRRSLRSKKGSSLKSLFAYSKKLNYTFLGLITNIFFNKKVFKLFIKISFKGGVETMIQAPYKSSLFSYFYIKKRALSLPSRGFLYDCQLFFLKHQTIISNLELKHLHGRSYIRAAGSKGMIVSVSKKTRTSIIKLPSGDLKLFSIFAFCSKGPVPLLEKKKIIKGDWRYKRLKGFRPVVRGIAMNPIDHPHGGKKKSVRFPRNPWGLAAKIK